MRVVCGMTAGAADSKILNLESARHFRIELNRPIRIRIFAGPYQRASSNWCTSVTAGTSLMPMTHAPETGTENPYQKTCSSFLQVCHANRY